MKDTGDIAEVPSDVPTWGPGQNYSQGEFTEYEGDVYKQLQTDHTTQEGWEPPAVPAIWEPV